MYMANTTITQINDTDCIGDSRITINTNFTNVLNIINSLFVGMIVPFPAVTAPTGFLALTGTTLGRTTYSNLWTYALTTGNVASAENVKTVGQFGPGDGSTTFSLPDVRGYFLRGVDLGVGIDIGRTIGSVQSDDFKTHTHLSPTTNGLPGAYEVANNNADYGYDYYPAVPTSATGGTETRPKNISVLYCIKY